MFSKDTSATRDFFSFERGVEEAATHGFGMALKRVLAVVGGGLLAAVAVLGALSAAYDTFAAGEISHGAGVTRLVVLGVAFAAGVYVAAYGYTDFDSERALRLTGKALLWTGIAVGAIAAIVLAGGFSWGSDDSDSSGGDSGGSDSGSGESTSGRSGHVWYWGQTSDASSWGGSATPAPGREETASVCLSCGKRMASAGGLCTGCAYRTTYSGALW